VFFRMMVFLGLGGFCFGLGLLSSSLGLDGSSLDLDFKLLSGSSYLLDLKALWLVFLWIWTLALVNSFVLSTGTKMLQALSSWKFFRQTSLLYR